MVIEYPGIEDAKQALHQFSMVFSEDKDIKGISIMEDGTWIAYSRHHRYFIGVFHAASKVLAKDLLQEALHSIDSSGL